MDTLGRKSSLNCSGLLGLGLELGLGVLIPGQRNQNNNKRWFPALSSIDRGPPTSQRERGREVRQATVAVAAHEVSPVLPGHQRVIIILPHPGTSRSHPPENEKGSDHNKITKGQRQDIASHRIASHPRTDKTTLIDSSTHPEHVVPLPYILFPLVRSQHLPMDLDVQFSRVPTPALSAVESTLDPVA